MGKSLENMFFKGRYQFLSNFYFSKFLYHGTFWKTVEHAYQASKCKDLDMDEEIRKAEHPAEAKKMGHRVDLRSDWEEVKVDIMTELVFRKFNQNKELKKKLLATGNLELEEGNSWHDNFWGNCYCGKCKDTPGVNVLGIILEEVRDNLRKRK